MRIGIAWTRPNSARSGGAAKLAFGTQPSNTVAGAAISPAVTVRVQDASGNLVTSSTASIILAIGTNPGGGTLTGTTTVSASSGVATFNNLSIDKVGTGYTLTASSTGLTDATSSSFNITVGPPSSVIYVSIDDLCNGHNPCVSNIQNAISQASDQSIIEITQETYDENIVLDVDKEIILEGGWNLSFGSCSSYTTINGSLTIKHGTIIIENITLSKRD